MSIELGSRPAQSSDDLSDQEIAGHFESLGDNCEFGFYQRAVGVDRVGLLRWSGTTLPGLLRGLAENYGCDDENLELRLLVLGDLNEFVLRAPRYSWDGHTFKYQGKHPAEIAADQAERYRFLARKLADDLEDGRKIFVYKQNDPVVDDSILVLHDTLNWHGANTLLWVCEAEGDHVPGSVQLIRDGLMKGYIDRLSPKGTGNPLSLPGWQAIARRAYACWTAEAARRKAPQQALRTVLLQTLDFGAGQNAAPCLRGGWHKPESKFTWASGPRSVLVLDKPTGASEYGLRIRVKPFRPDGLLKQRLSVLVNGHEIKRFSAVPDAEIVCTFPGAMLDGRSDLEITFVCPGALSPLKARESDDKRELAILFRTLRLYARHRP